MKKMMNPNEKRGREPGSFWCVLGFDDAWWVALVRSGSVLACIDFCCINVNIYVLQFEPKGVPGFFAHVFSSCSMCVV